MAKIKVDTEELRAFSQQLASLDSQLDSAVQQLAQVEDELDLEVAASSHIDAQLNRLEHRLRQQQQQLSQMAQMLNTVNDQFSATDKQLSQEAKGVNYLADQLLAMPYTPGSRLSLAIGSQLERIRTALGLFPGSNSPLSPILLTLLTASGGSALAAGGAALALGGSALAHSGSTPGFGTAAAGAAGPSTSGTEPLTWESFLKDDWNPKGSVSSGEMSKTGTIFGIASGGTLAGEFLGGEVKTTGEAKYNIDDRELKFTKGLEANGHLAKGSAKGNIGYGFGSVEGSVCNAAATGELGFSLMDEKRFSPKIQVGGEASVNVAEGEVEIGLGTEEYNIHGSADGSVLAAKADAGVGLGKITYKDSFGNVVSSYGAEASVSAEAYAAEGTLKGGFTIFDIDIDIGISGKVGGAGVSAGGRVTTRGVSGEIGAGLGLGTGVEFSIDWSKCSLW